jgi:hypothetical protein
MVSCLSKTVFLLLFSYIQILWLEEYVFVAFGVSE